MTSKRVGRSVAFLRGGWRGLLIYEVRFLRPHLKSHLLLGAALVVLAAVVHPFHGLTALALASLLGLVGHLLHLLASLESHLAIRIVSDDELRAQWLALVPSGALASTGFERVQVAPALETVLSSDPLNARLSRWNPVVTVDKARYRSIRNGLRHHGDHFAVALRVDARETRARGGTMHNDEKLCLASDVTADALEMKVSCGDYYTSFLTNELATRRLELTGPRVTEVFSGAEYLPGASLNSLMDLRCSHHIGVSTLAHTSDGYFYIVRQSLKAQQSQYLAAPSGSGSVDWSDRRPRMEDTIVAAMERELNEEVIRNSEHPLAAGEILGSSVTGYFIWLRRGAKPEFVGVTRLNAPCHRLLPDGDEVERPTQWSDWPAGSLEEAVRSLQAGIAAPGTSVPLFMAARCLLAGLRRDPETWSRFFGWR